MKIACFTFCSVSARSHIVALICTRPCFSWVSSRLLSKQHQCWSRGRVESQPQIKHCFLSDFQILLDKRCRCRAYAPCPRHCDWLVEDAAWGRGCQDGRGQSSPGCLWCPLVYKQISLQWQSGSEELNVLTWLTVWRGERKWAGLI